MSRIELNSFAQCSRMSNASACQAPRQRRSGPLEALAGTLDLLARVTALAVVVDQSHGLHKSVDGRRADEFPPPTLEVLGHLHRLGGARGQMTAGVAPSRSR